MASQGASPIFFSALAEPVVTLGKQLKNIHISGETN
jgi:hypothetical protein